MFRLKELMLGFVSFLVALTWCASGTTLAQTTIPGRQLTRENVKVLPPREKRWAVIVGVDKYDDAGITPLRGAANDAKTLAAALRDYAGFPEDQIVLLTTDEPKERQPTRTNVIKRLSNLKGTIPPDALLLVSFSGHGIERGGQAYLIPSDASFTDDPTLLEETALNVERIRNQIRATAVSQVLFLLDACRNDPVGGKSDSSNPLTQNFVRSFSFDTRNKDIQAFATLYATSVGDRAYEFAEKKQGYFTWAVVEGLMGKAANAVTGEVTLRSLVSYVENTVPRQVALDLGAAKKQKPFAVIEGYKADELVISVTAPKTVKPDIVKNDNQASQPTAGETAFWETIKNSADCGDYQAFLKEYPGSQFAATARFKIGKLCKDSPVASNDSTKPQGDIAKVPPAPDNGLYLDQSRKWLNMIVEEQYKEVISETSKSIESAETNIWAFRMRAVAHFLSGDMKKGSDDAARMLSLIPAPTTAREYEVRCYAYFATLRQEEAIADCSKSVELDPKAPFALITRGFVFRARREYDKAIEDFTVAMRLEPTFKWLYSERAEAYKGKKDLKSAVGDYSKAIEAYPKKSFFLTARAIVYDQLDETELALADLSKAIELTPGDATLHFNRGLVYNRLRKSADAIVDFSTALKLAPGDARIYFNRSISQEMAKNIKESIADISSAIQISPDVPLFFTRRADLAMMIDDLDRAFADYNEAIRLEPRDSRPLIGRAKIYQRRENFQQAINDFTAAIEVDGEAIDALLGRGFVYYVKSKYDLAFADLDKVTKLQPANADAYNYRGIIYLWKRDWDRAIEEFNQATKLRPDFAWALVNRCEAFNGKKQFDKAIADCSEVIRLFPDTAGGYKERAKAFEGKGDKALAEADKRMVDAIEKRNKRK